MAINNISKFGLAASFVWMIGFANRYLFIWYDPSQAINFIGLGAAWFAIFYLYHLYRNKIESDEKRFKHNENVLDEVELIIKREVEGKG